MSEYQYLRVHRWDSLEGFARAYRPRNWNSDEDVDLREARKLLREFMEEDQRVWERRYGRKKGEEVREEGSASASGKVIESGEGKYGKKEGGEKDGKGEGKVM